MAHASRSNRRNCQSSDSRENRRDRKARNGSVPKEGYGEYKRPSATQLDGFRPKTSGQRKMASSIDVNVLTFADGCAGTGKSYVALAKAVKLLLSGAIERIICTKPMVEIDEKLGTLPGDDQEKIAVSIKPMREILEKLLGKSHLENLIRAEKIIFAPLGSVLGLTFDDTFLFIDESQNSTPPQMMVLLTRLGQRSKAVVAGDAAGQKFIPGLSGLEDALIRLGAQPGVGHVRFSPDDIVRGDFCKQVILAYRLNDEKSS